MRGSGNNTAATVVAAPEERIGKVMTVRERMETHRKNPVCAACHLLDRFDLQELAELQAHGPITTDV